MNAAKKSRMNFPSSSTDANAIMSRAAPESSSLTVDGFATVFEEKINRAHQSFPSTSINTIHSLSHILISLNDISSLSRGYKVYRLSAGSYPIL